MATLDTIIGNPSPALMAIAGGGVLVLVLFLLWLRRDKEPIGKVALGSAPASVGVKVNQAKERTKVAMETGTVASDDRRSLESLFLDVVQSPLPTVAEVKDKGWEEIPDEIPSEVSPQILMEIPTRPFATLPTSRSLWERPDGEPAAGDEVDGEPLDDPSPTDEVEDVSDQHEFDPLVEPAAILVAAIRALADGVEATLHGDGTVTERAKRIEDDVLAAIRAVPLPDIVTVGVLASSMFARPWEGKA